MDAKILCDFWNKKQNYDFSSQMLKKMNEVFFFFKKKGENWHWPQPQTQSITNKKRKYFWWNIEHYGKSTVAAETGITVWH